MKVLVESEHHMKRINMILTCNISNPMLNIMIKHDVQDAEFEVIQEPAGSFN
jgi:hypothetical protein